MALFRRKDAPPADVLAQLPKTERVVSWADTADGSVVLLTPSGIWWPEPEGFRLIGWQYVDKATWQENVLTVIEADVVDDLLLVDRAPVSVRITVPRDLPPVLRKRVEANVVRSEVAPVLGGTARFVARRIPGEDGVRWWARLEAGTPDRDEVRSSVGGQLARLRAQWEEHSRSL